jgi:hypothetical protein
MALFANKDVEIKQPPIDKVRDMKQQGLSNNQIIDNLQKEKIPSSLIFDALNQSDIKPETSEEIPITPLTPKSTPTLINNDSSSQPNNEELIEAIIDEKWNELLKDINKIIEWKNRMDQKISAMDQQVSDMRHEFDKLHIAVVGKIGEYDKNILEVGADIKAMEQVFKKILPSFTENVKELSRITKTVKNKKNS